jgi:SET domain-containing protein
MTKEELLHELTHHNYVMLKPSPIHGIGVFAITDIPKGTRNIFSKGIGNWIKVTRQVVDALPQHSKDVVENYCLYDEEHYWLPDYGFKVIDVVCFLNHSAEPNVVSLNEGEEFEAIRDIKAGEELLLDYGEIVKEE